MKRGDLSAGWHYQRATFYHLIVEDEKIARKRYEYGFLDANRSSGLKISRYASAIPCTLAELL